MNPGAITLVIALLSTGILSFSCRGPESLWERKCASCHDGKTVLNEKVVPDKEGLRGKYRSLDAFVDACGDSPACMNILKHNKELLRDVGREIGIAEAPGT